MPSPFPGMDPYLEGSQWTSVHAELSVEIARQLAPRLPPRYVARTNERFVIIVPEPEHGTGARTTAIYPDESLRLLTVEIRDAAEMRLVTAIEVLSPTNKRGEGRAEYLMKRQRMLLGAAHLMEIDLLRSGHRLPMRDPLPGHPYFVFLSRAEKRPQTDVWPIGLGAPLPTVPVPLLPGDADVPLNLQEALGSVYDTFRYDRTINYALPPDVPLAPQEAAWADERLRRWRAAGTGR
jgi:Protein of unknown function (DUF4058)